MGRGGIREATQTSARRSAPSKHELSARQAAKALSDAGISIDDPVVEDRETAVQDFMTDLMHLVESRGWEWSELEARARRSFDAEMNLYARGESHDGAACDCAASSPLLELRPAREVLVAASHASA